MKLAWIAVPLFSLMLASAEDKKPAGDLGKLSPQTGAARHEKPRVSSASTLQDMVAGNVTIAPGANMRFMVPDDFTGAERASISMTTSADPNSSLKNVRIAVAWAGYSQLFCITDVVLGSTFYFVDHGGANVPVYGPNMLLVIFNDGTMPLNISQLAVYAVVY